MKPLQSHRAPRSEGPRALVQCSDVTVSRLPVTSEQGALRFHFALGPTNHATGPADESSEAPDGFLLLYPQKFWKGKREVPLFCSTQEPPS